MAKRFGFYARGASSRPPRSADSPCPRAPGYQSRSLGMLPPGIAMEMLTLEDRDPRHPLVSPSGSRPTGRSSPAESANRNCGIA